MSNQPTDGDTAFAAQQSTEASTSQQSDGASRNWQPLNRTQRRVVGVLIEKAKTTPDSYPLTLNAITTACNQKSNRKPQMDLDPDEVLLTLDELRDRRAVVEVRSGSRVSKYRHLMYDWLGVDKYELAVLAELLLRGEQTVGELRSRTARMESIAGISALMPIIESLVAKNLVVEVTPPGRGQIVDHALYAEKDRPARPAGNPAQRSTAKQPPLAAEDQPATTLPPSSPSHDELLAEISQLKQQLADLHERLTRIEGQHKP